MKEARKRLSSCGVTSPRWRQQEEECPIAVCEGNFTCMDNEVCVRPNECRCRHGYFGANCETKERQEERKRFY
ncbi:scavenger receptor class F member 2 [Crotalus adamanteus]|uniref:Scavenger receptor class F member 2 n=1 Tax=Crotalus adamanteus TaxID=8729 RepID=A0AAW1AP01_CROAD